MNILVYLGSHLGNRPMFKQAALDLGDWIAKRQDTLIYGGNENGLMGVLATKVKSGGGQVIGVMPKYLKDIATVNKNMDKLIWTQDMHERKNIMRDLAHVCIALPGGPGTLEEITEAFSLKVVGQNPNKVIVYNKEGYFDLLKDLYDQMVEEGFLSEENRKKILFTDSFDQMDKFIGGMDETI